MLKLYRPFAHLRVIFDQTPNSTFDSFFAKRSHINQLGVQFFEFFPV
jgi:hypothetical protein